MKITLQCTVNVECMEMRLDQALARLLPDYSRAQWQIWIKSGCVRVNNEVIDKTRFKVSENQQISVDAELEEQGDWEAQQIPLTIVYEDEELLLINKPAGLVVHPGAGNPNNTLMNALLHHDPNLVHIPRAGIVHRLDKDTSGILVIARTLSSHNYLTQAISNREVKREYQAIVHGELISGGTVKAQIDRHPTHRTKMAVKNGGREAITHYRIIQKFPYFTHIKCMLETGRTHQIRVHMNHINHPIVGDATYGFKRGFPGKLDVQLREYISHFPRQALHAWRLSLVHPHTHELMTWEAPLPQDMCDLLNELS